MTTINSEVYQALVEAGASEEKARAAAESVNAETSRLASIETNVNWLRWLIIGGFTVMVGGFSVLGNMLLKLTEMVAKAHGLG